MKKGLSLIEVIVSMVLISIIMYSSVQVFISSGAKGTNVEVFSIAQSLAENKLEENLSKSFTHISNEAQTAFLNQLSNYTYEILVNYVSKEALDMPVASTTKYKKIRVSIRHPSLSRPTSLESIRVNYL